MSRQPPAELALFFTRGVSLEDWRETGSLRREVAVYEALASRLGPVALVTYGGRSDLDVSSELNGLTVLCNKYGLPTRVYERLAPRLHAGTIAKGTVLKTNQASGFMLASRFRRHRLAPLIVRCGYMWSEAADAVHGPGSSEARRAARIERDSFSNADRVVVTTNRLKEYALRRYGLSPEKVSVIPNYVEIDRFRPDETAREPGRLIFVGRLAEEKGLLELLEALQGLPIQLTLVGQGPLRGAIERAAAARRISIELKGRVPNELVPRELNRAQLLLLPSKFEGHPKAAIEAMACGVPVVGADVPGINDLIEHDVTGFLAAREPAAIRAEVVRALADDDLRLAIGRRARRAIELAYSLDRVLELELDLIESVREGR